MNIFNSTYPPYHHEIKAFGANWCGPAKYETWKEVLIAQYVSTDNDDGQSVNVYCTAAPARFYRLEVLPGQNSFGEQRAGYSISTGSGVDQLSADLAKAISEGMIEFSPIKESVK